MAKRTKNAGPDANATTETLAVRVGRALAHPFAEPVIVVFAWALAIVHIETLRRTPLGGGLILDHRYYDEWAQRIAAGEWVGPRAFFVDPLYAYGLALVYKVMGHNLGWIRILQALMTALTAFVIGRSARFLQNQVGGDGQNGVVLGNVSVLAYALFLPAIYTAALIEKTTTATFLVALFLWLLLHSWRSRDARVIALSAVVLATAVLTRASLLVFFPVALWALWDSRPREQTDTREVLGKLAAFTVPFVLLVSLSWLHNQRAGDPTLLTANVGQNLYISHHEGNEHATYFSPPFARSDPRYEEGDFRAEAEKQLGREANSMRASEVSNHFRNLALHDMSEHPGRTLHQIALAFYRALHDYEIPDNDSFAVAAEYDALLRLPFLRFGLLVAFALFATIFAWREPFIRRAAMFAMSYFIGLSLFFVVGRFRLPVAPILFVLASAAPRAWRTLGPLPSLNLKLGAVLAGALLLALHIQPSWMSLSATHDLAIALHNVGAVEQSAGHNEAAVLAFERALSVNADAVPASAITAGEMLMASNELTRARVAVGMLLRVRPNHPRGRRLMISILERLAQDPRTTDHAEVADALRALRAGGNAPTDTAPSTEVDALYARARSEFSAGRHDNAIRTLQQAIAEGPYNENERYRLGGWMERFATPEAMIAYYRAQAAGDPKPQTSLYYWAVGLQRSGEIDAAIAKLGEALEVDPAHEMSENRLGSVYENEKHDLERALMHFQNAIAIHPEFRDAHLNMARVLDRLGRPDEAAQSRALAASSNPNSPRQFVYWARALMRAGRTDAARAELQRAIAQNPGDSEAQTLLREVGGTGSETNVAAVAAGSAGASLISAEITTRMISILGAGAGSDVWFAYSVVDPPSARMYEELSSIFAAAGWRVRGVERLSFRTRAGYFLYAADDTAPTNFDIIGRALHATGTDPQVFLGYREYARERAQANPSWQGINLGADQPMAVMIGRQGQ